ncbi:glycoside hydrolase family 3 N-terminal domain-containing protein [Nitratifractor sp.]|uniref:glycoside hydrolase family 3 protein n=1 Tax=Nitratifractor sp. TaxID=2268144 RepID=UPI0025D1462A|nr:glycoside hydrolase family 3 N-terminal domain-containing protein [Nitratifractor sp.]
MRFYGGILTLLLAAILPIFASGAQERQLERLAGGMLMVGFFGTEAGPKSEICRQIRRYGLGGVILFDRNPVDPKRPKNIVTPAQLKRLTRQLKACSPDGKLLIAVDQEGGVVQRLKSKNGFYGRFPRAADIAEAGESAAKRSFTKMAKELAQEGIDYDLAPVVDLALNPRNRVIVGWGRSYGKSAQRVTRYSALFIEAMHREGIVTALKHFPGHGSSLGDTHEGFVDVTQQWQPVELEPYRRLIRRGLADSVMVAHVFNRRLDPLYPASLSARTVTGLLRGKLGYRGVVITDDLQMGAITRRYSLARSVELAIEAGDDLLLFGNQLDPRRIESPRKLVRLIVKLVREGKIDRRRLEESAARLKRLKEKVR